MSEYSELDDRRPPILLCRSDRDVLERVALEAILDRPRVAGALLDEVDRAKVVADDQLGDDVVRLGSWVEFADSRTGEARTVRLGQTTARVCAGELSPLTSLAAALVGLSVGQAIAWPDRVGSQRVLTVLNTGVTANGTARASPAEGRMVADSRDKPATRSFTSSTTESEGRM